MTTHSASLIQRRTRPLVTALLGCLVCAFCACSSSSSSGRNRGSDAPLALDGRSNDRGGATPTDSANRDVPVDDRAGPGPTDVASRDEGSRDVVADVIG